MGQFCEDKKVLRVLMCVLHGFFAEGQDNCCILGSRLLLFLRVLYCIVGLELI